MKYPLRDLQNVRRFRESVAADAVNAARRQVEQAFERLQQQKKELDDYIRWRVEQEEVQYRKVMQQMVGLKDMNNLKAQIQWMRDGEAPHVENVAQAAFALEEAKMTMEHTMDLYRKAAKSVTKLNEHENIWKTCTEKEGERIAENAMNDFHTRANHYENETQEGPHEHNK